MKTAVTPVVYESPTPPALSGWWSRSALHVTSPAESVMPEHSVVEFGPF
jgi:hypothetical protein